MRRVPAQNLRPLLATALLVALLVPGALTAQEVIVKNDTVVDFGSAVVVGDFVPGEEAGAVLTMPQSGTNMFTLRAFDVTPAPYNQPPYPASGDSANDVCSVVGIAP